MYRFPRLWSNIAKRHVGSQAAAVQQSSQANQFSKLNSGLKVATSHENSPAARVVLLVNTGTRDDASSTLGLTHCLQTCAGLTATKNTAFLTTQLLSSLGADLEVTATRDHIFYNLSCYATAAQELVLDVLVPAVLGAKFPWWEIRDMSTARMRYHKACAENDPIYVLMEAAHKASFRGNFGQPVLSPDYMIGKHTSEMLSDRFQSSFTPDNMVLAATGITQGALEEIGSAVESIATGSSSSATRSKPDFVSSEVHVQKPGALVHAALSFEGVALNDKDAIALAVLQHTMGTGCNIKRGSGLANGVVNSAVENATNGVFTTSAYSVNYTDCGLFGLSIIAPPDNISSVVSATAAECEKIATQGIDQNAVEGGKQRLKAAILMENESGAGAADIAVQASTLDAVSSPAQIASLVDSVSAQYLAAVAQRVLSGKKSLATVGPSYNGPFVQEL
ncbi:cytochrome b-c1 complex subunit 2, mitochondrial-like [Clavelina lepadiformis]|uniref:cytochrome b-c1 complex subunit 2, mitochondrial-like n=1 Tax=Clavelina lepadiformis TaxID=159417 RepID=UPI004041AF53